MEEHNIRGGKKWKIAKAKAVFMFEQGKGKQEDADWFDTQASIVQDIEAYEDSIKTEDKPTKTEVKKTSKGA